MHPETPPEGVLLAEYFEGMDIDGFFRQMDAKGKDMGLRFGPQTLMSNSRLSLEAVEFAREQGLFEPFHEAVFKACFTDCQDIGSRETLLEIAAQVGLDAEALGKVLDEGRFRQKVEETTLHARKLGVRAAPTFIIQGVGAIVGAQPLEQFREALRMATGQE